MSHVFVIKLRRLVARAFPGQAQDGLRFNHFLMSLPDDYRVQVVAAGITSFEAAVTKVRNLRSALRVGAAEVRQLRADPDVVAQLQRRIEELERRLELESSGRSRAAPVRNSASPEGPMGAGQRRLCFTCGRRATLGQCVDTEERCVTGVRKGGIWLMCAVPGPRETDIGPGCASVPGPGGVRGYETGQRSEFERQHDFFSSAVWYRLFVPARHG